MLEETRPNSRRRFLFTARVLALGMAFDALVAIRNPARAAPADIFDVGAPALGAEPPKAADIQAGDTSVSSQTGALEYSYPIVVAPGRQGMQPHLALSYSSQAPIYGGIAAGWSLSIPIITLDTSLGRLRIQQPGAAKIYQSSMAGGRDLIPFDEPHGDDTTSYRAQADSSFTRYEQVNSASVPTEGYYWRALTTDGHTYYFGNLDHLAQCSNVSDEYAPLTRESDQFGNVVDYYYKLGAAGECVVYSIEWGTNLDAGISSPFARAWFTYSSSPPTCDGIAVGSQTSYRTGTKIVTGASELDSITITAFAPGNDASPDHTRVIALAYDAANAGNCVANHAAYRALASIQESAWNNNGVNCTGLNRCSEVDLPAVRFTYGNADFSALSFGDINWPAESALTPPWVGYEPNSFNLSWGYRFEDGKWPTLEAMLIDVDGDGLLDRVYNDPVKDGAGHVLSCRAQWRKNLGGLAQFAPPQPISLPTLQWGPSPETCGPATGGSWANMVASDDPEEGCALNYQETGYANSRTSAFGTVGVCPYDGDGSCLPSGYCSDGRDCLFAPVDEATYGGNYLAYRWIDANGDGLVDLIASPAAGTDYELYRGIGVGGCTNMDPEPPIFGTAFPPSCPAVSASVTGQQAGAYTMCNGLYPWFIYYNHGNGVFGLPATYGSSPTPDRVVYQPIPLETQGTDSSITSAPVGQNQGVLDLDGDGLADGIYTPLPASAPSWTAFRNTQTGELAAASGATPYSFAVPTAALLSAFFNLAAPDNPGEPSQTQGLIDLNGDGLPDQWTLASDQTSVWFNDGVQLRQPAEVTLNVRPGNDGVSTLVPYAGQSPPNFVRGYRLDSSRTLDVDLDGRPDVVQYAPGTETLATYFNIGGQFYLRSSPESSPNLPTGGAQHKIVSDVPTVSPYAPWNTFSWEVRSDMVDLDGDGIPEGYDFLSGDDGVSNAESLQVSIPTGRDQGPIVPPRLLVAIDNQRGATTSITYASMSNAAVVTQAPQNGKYMPRWQWVVQSIATTDHLDTPATTSTTSYSYTGPHFSADDRGLYAFRGFDEADAVLPSGAMRVDRYDYSVDWSGRLHQTVIRPSVGESSIADEARTIDTTTWEPHHLCWYTEDEDGGVEPWCPITTYGASVAEHLTCHNGQSDDLTSLTPCSATTAAGYTKTTSTWSPLASTTTTDNTQLLWAVTTSTLQPGTSAADGDRQTIQTFAVDSDEDTYRVRPLRSTKQVLDGATWTTFAQNETAWDSAYLVPTDDYVWLDTSASLDTCTTSQPNCAVTHRVYDLSTGNLIQRYKPIQYAGDGAHASYSYDSRLLFVASAFSESAGSPAASQELDYTWDYGTGTKLSTLGPNVPTCANTTPDTCNGTPLKETNLLHVDGLGRAIDRWGSTGINTATYPQYELEMFEYYDSSYATSGVATSVYHQSGYDLATGGVPMYANDQTYLDGHGRPVQKTVYVQGTAPADQITRFSYGNDGTLASVSVPDPSKNDTSTVTYTYAFDSLGRPTSIQRPDSATDASRVDMTYDGVTTTSSEHVGASGGQPASTRTIKDSFGRLVEVDEALDASRTSWAATHYAYDAQDNVQQVVDPETLTTTLGHDLGGRRISITRSSRSWSYGYDKNGNMIYEITPGYDVVTGDGIANYTTTTAYDDLDRPVSKVVAPRELSPSDLALFGADHETFTWDYNTNRKGHLYAAETYAPGESGSNYASLYQLNWDAAGAIYETIDSFSSSGYSNLLRETELTHTLNGSPRLATYLDSVGGNHHTYAQVHYDARGLPHHIQLTSDDGLDTGVATTTRNVAGLATDQYTNLSGPVTAVHSLWAYDSLGRVASQLVQTNPGPTMVAEQELSYFGNDDPNTLDHYLGDSNHKQLQYLYDFRHQLVQANETTTPNYFSGQYTFGPAGRFTTASEKSLLPPNSDVTPRDVTYEYGADDGVHDPEEVVALANNVDETTFASYDYDAVGNQTVRCLGTLDYDTHACSGQSWQFIYDGKDQLRRASHFDPGGDLLGSEEYWYDPYGKRTQTVKRDNLGNKTELVYWIGDVEAHYDGSGNVTHIYSYLNMGTTVARVDRTSNTAPSVELLFHGLGDSTLAAVDKATGSINASFSYAPFGEVLEATDGGGSEGLASHNRKFNDKYEDRISGLAYYGARYYDGVSMTWTQGDPLYRFVPDLALLSTPRKANLYSFSLNNALRYSDPDGRDSSTSFLPDSSIGCDGVHRLCQGEPVVDTPPPEVDTPETETPERADARAKEIFEGATEGPEGSSMGTPSDGPGGGTDAPDWLARTEKSEAFELLSFGDINGAKERLRKAADDEIARGGVYTLIDPSTGEVMRSGRTNDLARRGREHGRDPRFEGLTFTVEYRTDSYAEQRGLEQMVHDGYSPPLNRIRAIAEDNPRLAEYLAAAVNFLSAP